MENDLETYCAAIEAQLRDVPAARRAEFMDEVRAHLYAMWEAKRADGFDAATAWQSAMREFGEPEKVGRDLRRQWANSAQLESEEVPLSLRRKWRIFALPVLACVVVYAFAMIVISPKNPPVWSIPILAAVYFGCPLFAFVKDAQKHGGLKPSMIVGYFSSFIIGANCLFDISGHHNWGGEWQSTIIPIFAIASAPLYFWLKKLERADRPWQFSARFKSSPVAAEQEYRLARIAGLWMGTAMGCINILWLGSQFFGLPIALLLCTGLIGGAIYLGRWLIK